MSDKIPASSGDPHTLKKVTGPMLLWGVGVGAVISGNYYGWNAGLKQTGYWGYLIALAIMGLLYFVLSFSIAELASAIPHSGGAYAYTRMALGKFWGYLAGVSVLLEFVIAPIAVSLTVGAYFQVLLPGVPILASAAALYAVSVLIHTMGTGGSMKFEFSVTIIAMIGLVAFCIYLVPHFTTGNLNLYGSGIMPNGISGFWATLPLAAWFFFGIESLPMTAEETRDPTKDLPRALTLSFISLAIIGVATLTMASSVGSSELPNAAAPLATVIQHVTGNRGWITPVITLFALVALIASFHAIIFGASRQMFALSRAGYLPPFLSRLNSRRVPHWSLIVPSVIGFMFAVIGDRLIPDIIPILVTLSVFVAAVSYLLMIVDCLVIRRSRPDIHRPYTAPGGSPTLIIGAVLAITLIPAAVMAYPLAFLIGVAVFALAIIYYLTYANRKVVFATAEEELSAVTQAAQELS